jgi:hypothetical protein
VVIKPVEDLTTRIVGNIAWFLFLASVYISTFYSWPSHYEARTCQNLV